MAVYLGIFKEPRGLIRFLQFIIAICAFATACNGRSSVSLTNTVQNETASASWSYPYNLKSSQIQISSINGTTVMPISDQYNPKPSAEFFVFTGVTSMLLGMAFLAVYVFLDQQYRNDDRLSLADFTISIIWTIFWLVGSSAWAQGVARIRSATDSGNIGTISGICPASTDCYANQTGNYANIIVSVIFGFLNFFLWLAGIWFIYKETRFFKSRTEQPNNFSNIGSPPMPNQGSQPRPPGSLG